MAKTMPARKAPPNRARKAAPLMRSDVPQLQQRGTKEQPFLRFYFSDELRAKTLGVLAALEQAPDPGKHKDALADVVVQLTSAGMDYYFMRPLTAATAGFVTQQSAKLGLAGAMQVMGSVIRSVIGRMEPKQLLSVCGSIRELMH
jgi:hypothetical protein